MADVSQAEKPLRVACPNCGVEFDARKPHKPRSVDEHRRFFGIVRAAFENWPEDHSFQPETPEHLRAWLICQAGPLYRTIEEITVPDAAPQIVAAMMAIVETLIAREDGFKFSRWKGFKLTIFRPKSLRFDKMKHGDFHELNERVSETVSAALGITIKELLGETDD